MVEVFVLKTLPQVLEGQYGYRLFILGRDGLPGQGRTNWPQYGTPRDLNYSPPPFSFQFNLFWIDFTAIADVVSETISLSRRLLLLYTDSSLRRTENQTWLEQQTGLHRALIDDALPVVLLEMKELSDPSILPESLRLLRERQGAVQAWRKRRRWSCQVSEHDEEALESLSLPTLPSRFWREVRYHMPVRGKARGHARKNVLLNLWVYTWDLNENSKSQSER